ncbi:hypothetical protein FE257_004539 [Aspergillus nanangensis]|uniref:Uncharacterized protein n=1 Tax=Aspergillus nanangensis TaxID=2582783 RepID=A0AAD4D057_ASPNN|nr:hypothetical protein FE257_004539 [Aspergillus nanangensis]
MAYLTTTHLQCLHQAGEGLIAQLQREPTSRYETTSVSDDQPCIPNPQLFHSTSSKPPTNARERELPTISDCAIHLELLEVFHTLREQILYSNDLDNAFGIEIRKKTVHRNRYTQGQPTPETEEFHVRDDTWESRRREKWSYFLELAVGRFRTWIRIADDLWKQKSTGKTSAAPSGVELSPPLDVLMVWHSFLLNPQDFDMYCKLNSLNWIRGARFPWGRIHEAINAKDWTYTLPQPIEDWLLETEKMEPDLLATLCKAGKSKSRTRSLLSRYGAGTTATSIEVTDLNSDTTPLVTRELYFLRASQSAILQSQENKPLVGHVQRQVGFINKMHDHLWIKSPAVRGTLRRAIARYEKFARLFGLYQEMIFVPTLDIDFIWHTHQCNACKYEEYMVEHTGRFVRHNDRVGRSILRRGMDLTQQLFFEKYGEKYHTCLCWNCEAILDGLEKCDRDSGEVDAGELAKVIEEMVYFYAAVEIARRKGWPIPVRDL